MAGESGVEAAFSRWMMRANVTCRLKEEVLTALGKEGMRWHASESKNVRCVSFPKKTPAASMQRDEDCAQTAMWQ